MSWNELTRRQQRILIKLFGGGSLRGDDSVETADLIQRGLVTRNGVRQESWQRIGGESPPRGRSSQPPRPRVMHEVLLARAAVKRSQGRPRAKY